LRKGYELQVTRTLPAQTGTARVLYPSVRLELGSGQVLGVFAAGQAGETQALTVHLDAQAAPSETPNAFALKVVEDAGANAVATDAEVQIGELEFSEPWSGAKWAPFAAPSGELLGVTSHVYRYVGSADFGGEAPADYEPFDCAPMPALRR
jgi:hypothetical protein